MQIKLAMINFCIAQKVCVVRLPAGAPRHAT
jgi:hypothetical protein